MAKELKKLIVEELSERYRSMDRCVVLNLTGLSAKAADEIRKRLRSHNITVRVIKNSMVVKALSNVGLEKLVPLFEGPSAIATGGSDVVDLAKMLTETAGKVKQVVIKGGFAEGLVLGLQEVRKFASIPPRPALVAAFLSLAQGPVRNFAGTMSTFPRNFVGVLDAVAKKRAAEAAETEPAEAAAQTPSP